MTRMLPFLLLLTLSVPEGAMGQDVVSADVWRTFAEQLDIGTELHVRLRDGQRFRARLIGTREDALLLQPKTRVPVAVQPVPYDTIASLERRSDGGIGAGKAAAIGVASGVGAFLGMLLILFAAVGD